MKRHSEKCWLTVESIALLIEISVNFTFSLIYTVCSSTGIGFVDTVLVKNSIRFSELLNLQILHRMMFYNMLSPT